MSINYKAVLTEAFTAPGDPEPGIGACRVYVSLIGKEHVKGIAAAAKSLGKIFQKKAYYGLTNALYIGYDNFSGSELSRGNNGPPGPNLGGNPVLPERRRGLIAPPLWGNS